MQERDVDDVAAVDADDGDGFGNGVASAAESQIVLGTLGEAVPGVMAIPTTGVENDVLYHGDDFGCC